MREGGREGEKGKEGERERGREAGTDLMWNQTLVELHES